jgi:hypothetical protein
MLCRNEDSGLTEAEEHDEVGEGRKRVEHGCGVDGDGDGDQNTDTWL